MDRKPIKAKDRIGQVFGSLKISSIYYVKDKRNANLAMAECICVCGSQVKTTILSLTSVGKNSCGCKHKKPMSNLKHGHNCTGKTTKAYKLWSSIKRRCFTPSASGYYKYGAKGVTVCDRWKDSFENFLADMGEPQPGMSIDRIDNSKGYEPSNCRWATVKEQARNKTSNWLLSLDGETKSLAEWAEIYKPKYGVSYATVQNRLYRGWDFETALTLPPLDPKHPEKYINQNRKGSASE